MRVLGAREASISSVQTYSASRETHISDASFDARLDALRDTELLDTPPDALFDDIVTLAAKLCDTPVALVSLVDSTRQWFLARLGFEASETPIEQSVCAYAIREKEILIIPDLTKDVRTASNTLVTSPPHIRFYAGAVLRTDEGHALGTICVIDRDPRPQGLTDDQTRSLLALARQTMALISLRKAVIDRDEVLQRFQHAQEVGQIGVFEMDLRGSICIVSPELCHIFGIPIKPEVAIEELQNILLPSDRPIASTFEQRLAGTATSSIEARLRRPNDGAMRWISRRAVFRRDSRGTPVRMVGIIQDITHQKLDDLRQKALLRLAEGLRAIDHIEEAETLAASTVGEALTATKAGYGVVDVQANLIEVAGAWDSSGATDKAMHHSLAGFSVSMGRLRRGVAIVVDDIDTASWLNGDADNYRAFGIAANISAPVIQDGTLVGVLFVNNDTARHWSSAEVAFVRSVADYTHAAIARLRAEEERKVLSQELSHRLKNTLAMVQSIASQTLRKTSDTEDLKAFTHRINALSSAHDVLLQESWAQARIMTVVDGALRGQPDRIRVDGPNISLGPKASLSLALLLHELATNASKYGAFSTSPGKVDLTWHVDTTADEPMLVLCWAEKDGPLVEPPQRKGFGTRLIEMGLAGARGAVLNYAPSGFTAEFRAPLYSVIAQ